MSGGSGFGFWVLGYGVGGVVFKDHGSGFWGLGAEFQILGRRIQGLTFGVWDLEIRV